MLHRSLCYPKSELFLFTGCDSITAWFWIKELQGLCASSWSSGLIIDAERQMMIDISTLRCHKCHRSSTASLDNCWWVPISGCPPTESHTDPQLNLYQAGECNTSRQHLHSVIMLHIDCEVSRHDTHSY